MVVLKSYIAHKYGICVNKYPEECRYFVKFVNMCKTGDLTALWTKMCIQV